jgi:hypothetical protein
MLDLRTLGLGIGVFSATFLIGWWLNVGSLASAVGGPAAKAPTASEPAPQTVGQAPAVKVAARMPETPMPQGKGLTDNDLMRRAVISWSKSYQRPACNQDTNWGYVGAATKYAEVLMRSAGCNNFPRCPMSMGQLERVWQANRSALDLPVAEAMAAAHAAGGLSEKSFRGDVGRAVRVISGRDFEPGPAPRCSTNSNRSWSFRVRRR